MRIASGTTLLLGGGQGSPVAETDIGKCNEGDESDDVGASKSLLVHPGMASALGRAHAVGSDVLLTCTRGPPPYTKGRLFGQLLSDSPSDTRPKKEVAEREGAVGGRRGSLP